MMFIIEQNIRLANGKPKPKSNYTHKHSSGLNLKLLLKVVYISTNLQTSLYFFTI